MQPPTIHTFNIYAALNRTITYVRAYHVNRLRRRLRSPRLIGPIACLDLGARPTYCSDPPEGINEKRAPITFLCLSLSFSHSLYSDRRKLIDEAPADAKITTEISFSSFETLIELYRYKQIYC